MKSGKNFAEKKFAEYDSPRYRKNGVFELGFSTVLSKSFKFLNMLNHRRPQSEHFFPKSKHLFPIFENGNGNPLSLPHLVTCLI